jgi:hypothetical protein
MLTQDKDHRTEQWIVVARNWGESCQALVRASTGFSTISRELADSLDAALLPRPEELTREDLARDLRRIADLIEAQVRVLRDDYLATAAGLADLGMERPSVGPD